MQSSDIYICIYIFTNPSSRAGYDTRSIFKLAAFIREQVWHKAIWMEHPMIFELTRVGLLEGFFFCIGLYRSHCYVCVGGSERAGDEYLPNDKEIENLELVEWFSFFYFIILLLLIHWLYDTFVSSTCLLLFSFLSWRFIFQTNDNHIYQPHRSGRIWHKVSF